MIELISKDDIETFLSHNVPKKRKFLQKIFRGYLRYFTTLGKPIELLDYAQNIYNINTQTQTQFCWFDKRIQQFLSSDEGLIYRAALQSNDIDFYRFLYYVFFKEADFDYLSVNGTSINWSFAGADFGRTTDLVPLEHTDDLGIEDTDSEHPYLFAAFVSVDPDSFEEQKKQLDDRFRMRLAIVSPGRILVATIWTVIMNPLIDSNPFGTVTVNGFFGKTYEEVFPWLQNVKNVRITHWDGSKQIDTVRGSLFPLRKFQEIVGYRYWYNYFGQDVKALDFLIQDSDGAYVSVYSVTMNKNWYIPSDYYDRNSCWMLRVDFETTTLNENVDSE